MNWLFLQLRSGECLCLWRGRRKSFISKVRDFSLTRLSIINVSFRQARYSRENLVLKFISSNQKGNWLL